MAPAGCTLTEASGLAQFSPDDRRIYIFGSPDFAGRKAVLLRSIGVDGKGVMMVGRTPRLPIPVTSCSVRTV